MSRQERRVRLIALDIDGTLVGEDGIIGPRTRAAIADAAERGIAVSLVTGRMATSALPFATSLGLRGPIVAQQGALIRAMPDPGKGLGRMLFHRPLAAEVTAEIVQWARGEGLKAHFNYLERLIVQRQDPDLPEFRAYVGDQITIVDDLLDRARRPVTKIVLVAGRDGHPIELFEAARSRFEGRAAVTLSHPRFLEFMDPTISKGYAIRWLARRLRVPLAETLAVGDQYTDLEMIEEAGFGIAMPTAPEAVRAVAGYVAPPVEEEGAAQMIEQLALSARGVRLPDVALHVPEAVDAAEALEAGEPVEGRR